jgi:hypothetical protein
LKKQENKKRGGKLWEARTNGTGKTQNEEEDMERDSLFGQGPPLLFWGEIKDWGIRANCEKRGS